MCCSQQKVCRIHYVKITDEKRVEVFGLGISMGQYEHKSTCYFIKTKYACGIASTSCLIAVTIASLLKGGYGFSQHVQDRCKGALRRRIHAAYPSQTPNYARLLIVATQSILSRLLKDRMATMYVT